jgi:hypothetical protein
MGPIKKGILSGLAAGILMAIYSNTTSCHPSILGGGMDTCANSTELILGLFEFLLYFPVVNLLGVAGISLNGEVGFRILLVASPIIVLTIGGFILGLAVKGAKKKII